MIRLLCQLLRIDSPETLAIHPLRGEIFESFVVSELQKYYFALGKEPQLYFWRDQHKHEIDVIVDKGTHLFPVEIKSGKTFHEGWLRTLKWFRSINAEMPQSTQSIDALIYGGDDHFKSEETEVFSWKEIFEFGKNFC